MRLCAEHAAVNNLLQITTKWRVSGKLPKFTVLFLEKLLVSRYSKKSEVNGCQFSKLKTIRYLWRRIFFNQVGKYNTGCSKKAFVSPDLPVFDENTTFCKLIQTELEEVVKKCVDQISDFVPQRWEIGFQSCSNTVFSASPLLGVSSSPHFAQNDPDFYLSKWISGSNT